MQRTITKEHKYKIGKANTKHGESTRTTVSPEYRAWQQMKNRCINHKASYYHRYGGRGIHFCKRWEKFSNFLADMGRRPSPKHSLERKNNDGHYNKRNCRWATLAEQASNTSICHRIAYKGKTQSLNAWAKELKIQYSTIYSLVVRHRFPLSKAINRLKNNDKTRINKQQQNG